MVIREVFRVIFRSSCRSIFSFSSTELLSGAVDQNHNFRRFIFYNFPKTELLISI